MKHTQRCHRHQPRASPNTHRNSEDITLPGQVTSPREPIDQPTKQPPPSRTNPPVFPTKQSTTDTTTHELQHRPSLPPMTRAPTQPDVDLPPLPLPPPSDTHYCNALLCSLFNPTPVTSPGAPRSVIPMGYRVRVRVGSTHGCEKHHIIGHPPPTTYTKR